MRIEILVDNEEPRVFLLNKPKLLIGSVETCDVILSASGISRKHLAITVEDDRYFVVDQGSTNGSYINEERLIPGRKTDFTTFFPVRLGDNVLITLLSDDDAEELGLPEPVVSSRREVTSPNFRPDATRAVPLSSLQGQKTSNLVKKRTENSVKRKTDKTPAKNGSKKSAESSNFLIKIIPAIILAVGIYFNFFATEDVVEAPAPQVTKPADNQPTQVAPEPPKIKKVDAGSLTPKAKFEALLSDIHCTNDTEKYLCDTYATSPTLKHLGTVQVGTMVNSIFDGQIYYEKARTLVPEIEPKVQGQPDAEEIREYNDNVNFVTMLLFVTEGLPKGIAWEKLQDVELTFALKITHVGPESDVENQNLITAAFVPETLKKLLTTYEPVHVTMIKKYGARSINFLRDYFTMY